jgi:predicted ester cyclase
MTRSAGAPSAPLASTNRKRIVELFRREPSHDEHGAIRDLWREHAKAEDARDTEGLLATLTDACVYELPLSGHRWEGHAGAREFYRELFGALPDIRFALTNITIGPQGVVEEATVTASQASSWLGLPPTGRPLAFRAVITFPWDRTARLFTGERIYLLGLDLPRAAAGAG